MACRMVGFVGRGIVVEDAFEDIRAVLGKGLWVANAGCESGDAGEEVRVLEGEFQRSETAHGHPCDSALVAHGIGAIGLVNQRD